jgi:hypothetical protein
MAKVYLLTETDFERLLLNIDRDPHHGDNGGSSRVLTEQESSVHKETHKRFNYWVRVWIDSVKK